MSPLTKLSIIAVAWLFVAGCAYWEEPIRRSYRVWKHDLRRWGII